MLPSPKFKNDGCSFPQNLKKNNMLSENFQNNVGEKGK
jgi:hypothetical protein